MKYLAKVRDTGQWIEITEYEFNALYLGASWGIYCAARSEVIK